MRIITNIDDSNFVRVIIPKMLKQIIIEEAVRCHNSMKDIKMINYISQTKNLEMAFILDEIEHFINVDRVGKEFIISIDNNKYMFNTNYKYIDLINLIDCGNLDVKGLNIVNKSMKYIQHKLKFIFKRYEKGSMRYGY